MLCTFLLTAFGAYYFHTACKSAILAVLEVPFPTAEMFLLWIKYFTCSDLPEWLQLIDNCEFVSLKMAAMSAFTAIYVIVYSCYCYHCSCGNHSFYY